MNEEIQKLIDIAKEGGKITEKQKEIILRKTEKLGEDVDEVEMVLETIQTSKKERDSHIKLRKCLRCGAVVPEGMIKCPECGIVMETETESNAQTRARFDELEKKIKRLDNYDDEDDQLKKKLKAIGSFTVPMVKGAQIMAFNYTNARADTFLNRNRDYYENAEYLAWLNKAKEFYNNIASMATDDVEIQNWLKANEKIANRIGKRVLTTPLGVIFAILLVAAISVAVYFECVYIESKFWKVLAVIVTQLMWCFLDALPKKDV